MPGARAHVLAFQTGAVALCAQKGIGVVDGSDELADVPKVVVFGPRRGNAPRGNDDACEAALHKPGVHYEIERRAGDVSTPLIRFVRVDDGPAIISAPRANHDAASRTKVLVKPKADTIIVERYR